MALVNELEKQGNFLFTYRSYLPLILFPPAFYIMSRSLESAPELFSLTSVTTLELLAIIVCLFGLMIRVITVGYTPANTSGRNTSEGQVAETINTTGMYSTVRHPLYVGNYFMWLGIAILTGNVWFLLVFTLTYWLYYERIMFAEEQFLIRKFGERYTNWSNHTPAFIPDILAWQKPNLSFSWKKVLKKEKNGLFAIFLIVLIFDVWQHYLQTRKITSEKNALLYLSVGTGIFYLVFKIIKSKTAWLDEEGR